MSPKVGPDTDADADADVDDDGVIPKVKSRNLREFERKIVTDEKDQ